MKVEINHPHAAAIAAFYSGKRVRTAGGDWMSLEHNTPVFSSNFHYEIEPETKVRYIAMYKTTTQGVVLAATEYRDEHACRQWYGERDDYRGIVRKTYTDNVLTSLEILKEKETK